jgi:DNA-binding beta-propeller fold protein YncE
MIGRGLMLLVTSVLSVIPVCAQAPLSTAGGTSLDVDINGILTVIDSRASTLRQYSRDLRLLREIGGQGWGNDQFDRPAGVWARNGLDVFVADYGNHRIQRFDKNLAFVSTLSTRDSDNPDQRFGYPLDVSISRLGELYICDSENERIVKVGTSNTIERTFGGYGAGSGRLYHPVMAKCGPGDDIYVLDPPRVLIFDTFGNSLGELASGMVTHPLSIAADQRTVAVLDSTQVFFFGPGSRMEGMIPLPAPGKEGAICCALSRDSLYLLGASGLTVIPVPLQPDR